MSVAGQAALVGQPCIKGVHVHLLCNRQSATPRLGVFRCQFNNSPPLIEDYATQNSVTSHQVKLERFRNGLHLVSICVKKGVVCSGMPYGEYTKCGLSAVWIECSVDWVQCGDEHWVWRSTYNFSNISHCVVWSLMTTVQLQAEMERGND